MHSGVFDNNVLLSRSTNLEFGEKIINVFISQLLPNLKLMNHYDAPEDTLIFEPDGIDIEELFTYL